MKTIESSPLNDRDLIYEIKNNQETSSKNRWILFKRYENLIHKHWHGLRNTLDNSRYVQDVKDDFYSDAFITFCSALDAINLDKVRDNKWKFLGYFGWYLSNQRNSSARRIIKKHQKETAIEIAVENPRSSRPKNIYITDSFDHLSSLSTEEEVIKNDESQRFWTALNRCKTKIWSSVESEIFDRREKGESIGTIGQSMKLSTPIIRKTLSSMLSTLKVEAEKSF